MKRITQIAAVSFALAVAGCATQKMQTSSSAESGVYTIMAGDTFAKIAKTHHLTIRQLQDLNPDAKPTRLKIGQQLYVVTQAGK
jgi:LysM repeat protein